MPNLDVLPILELPRIFIEDDDHKLELDTESVAALASISIRNSTGYVTALTQSVANEFFLQQHENQGFRLLLEKNRELTELVRVSPI